MIKHRREFRRFHKSIWRALALFVLLGFLLQNVAGSAYYSLLLQSQATVTSPPVKLGQGTTGSSEIYSDNTSAKVSVAAPIAPPALIFESGFETGNFSEWTATDSATGCSITTVTNITHAGSYAARSYTDNPDEWAVARKDFSQLYNTLFGRVYVQFTALPAADGNIFRAIYILHIATAAPWYRALAAGGVKNVAGTSKWYLQYRNGTVFSELTASTSLPQANKWYSIEIKAVRSGTAGEARLWIDGTEILSATGLDNDEWTDNSRFEVGLGGDPSSSPTTIYVDSAKVAQTYVGPEAYDFVDNNISDVDSSADKGTHSNFAAEKSGPNSIYDTLTEEANFRVKKGTFTKATTTGTQTISGVGFTPKAVILWWTRQTSYGELAAIHVGYGAATNYGGTYQNRGVAFASDDAAGSANTGRRRSETYSIIILSSGAPVLAAQASVTAFNSDGFTLNWQTNEARADIIHFIALGGIDLSNTKAGSFSLTTTTGNQGITGVGFQPDFIMFLWTFTEAADTNTAQAEVGVGFAVSSAKRGALVANSEDAGGTMDTWQQQRTDSCILLLDPTSGAQDAIIDFVSKDNDGFTVNKVDAPAVITPIFYLALKGGSYDVGSFNSPTATGNQDVTSIGFQPKLVVLATQGRASATAIGSHSELSFGAATSSTERGVSWFEDPDALADSDNKMETLNTRIIQWRDRTALDTFTLRGSADFVSMLSNGFRLSWSNVETAGREIIYVAFGNVGDSYQLDLEIQWTNVDYDETSEELCIYGGTMGAENIRVDVWNGSSWQNLYTDLYSGWNNASVSPYLTSPTFTVRFKGGTETGDTTQDNWDIDAALLHVWTGRNSTYNYVLKITNQVFEAWKIRLKAYSQSNIGRLNNFTIYFRNASDGTSGQIYIVNGAYTQQTGPWYDLPVSPAERYIAVILQANSLEVSYVYIYLEILVPNKTTYAQYVITFEIT